MSKRSVTLTFKNEVQRKWFVRQLTDGFGENECYIKWTGNIDATEADKLFVDVSDNETFQHHQRIDSRYGLGGR